MSDSVARAPSALGAHVSLFWQRGLRGLSRFLRGDVLAKDSYAAFISYRHVEPDRRWAIWLHGALESFVIPGALRNPPHRRRIGRVFRDEEELATSSHLSADIKAALDRSAWLLVVCSPRAVESKWVNAEIEYFRALDRGDKIRALLIEGEPNGSFPKTLYEIGAGEDEPLAADVRATGGVRPGRAKRTALLRLAASVLGCKFDDLRQREQERHTRRLIAFSAVTSIVALGLGIAAFEAFRQAQTALKNESAGLAAIATVESRAHPVQATKLALSGWPRGGELIVSNPKLRETLDALGRALPELLERRRIDDARSGTFSPNGDLIVTVSTGNVARVWSKMGQPRFALVGHTGWVHFAGFSPNSNLIVTVSFDGTGRTWDSHSGREIAKIECQSCRFSSAAFSADSAFLLMTSLSRGAQIWDAITGQKVSDLSPEQIDFGAFSDDGKRILTRSKESIRIWKSSPLEEVAFSPNGENVATGSLTGVRVWNATMDKVVNEFSAYMPSDPEASLLNGRGLIGLGSFSRDGRGIMLLDGDLAWNWTWTKSDLQVVKFAGHTGRVTSGSFSANGAWVLTTSFDGTARIWSASTGQPVVTLEGHDGAVGLAAFSPDDNLVLTAAADNSVRIWETKATLSAKIIEGRHGRFNSSDVSPDGRRVAVTTVDGWVQVLDAIIAQEILAVKFPASSAAFSPDGLKLLTASGSDAVVLDGVTGKEMQRFRGHLGEVTSAKFSPDGSFVITGSRDATARIWDAATARELFVLPGANGQVTSAAFSPDGLRAVTTTSWGENSVQVWDVLKTQRIANLSRQYGVINLASFSPDGSKVVIVHGNDIIIWNFGTGTENLIKAHKEEVSSASFDSTGTRLATSSADHTTKIWDATTGEELLTLIGHSAAVVSASFTHDGTRVVSASRDGTVRVWDVSGIPAGNILEVACAYLRMHDGPGSIKLESITGFPFTFDRPICEHDPPPPDSGMLAAQSTTAPLAR